MSLSMQSDGEDHFLSFLREQEEKSVLKPPETEDTTQVLDGAEHVFHNSIDVSLSLQGVKSAASMLYNKMTSENYSTKNWSTHELHPKAKDERTVDFIFTMDLLNFSFWSENSTEERFAVAYKDKKWTGYWSLVAALQRALEENIPITSPEFWVNEDKCTGEILKYTFRSATMEEIPLFQERVSFLRQAGKILIEKFNGSFLGCVQEADHSAVKLVNLLAYNFPCFNDVIDFEGRSIRFLKRAQICVADLWAAFDGKHYGKFYDIEKLTIFADYRIPQILNTLGCLLYSPPLENTIRSTKAIESGHPWEIQIRGCSIWCVELIIKEILRHHPKFEVNTTMIDFFLYDLIKDWEKTNQPINLPHHRTRSVWY
ncbi:Queuosine salvage protein [Erysiphe neolycopersici]|uniref:Queuosine 5'-phosphate N-glycosylase/hydrolase n=1 Tax=Erysiphe neolycopersici TaxID=212602 RepID=A0A420HDU9_9PEZI|nr:Queuosine salvage protein [Erysiphe neolycopersici]